MTLFPYTTLFRSVKTGWSNFGSEKLRIRIFTFMELSVSVSAIFSPYAKIIRIRIRNYPYPFNPDTGNLWKIIYGYWFKYGYRTNNCQIIELCTLRYKRVTCCCLETMTKTNLAETKSILHSQTKVLHGKEWRIKKWR